MLQICVPGYSRTVRDVSEATKNQVYAEYSITNRVTGQYEIDHLIPLELGGSNAITNLWPEPAEPRPGFHEKDILENTLHALVCAGPLDLGVAQHAIASNWYQTYQQYVLGAGATSSASPSPASPPPIATATATISMPLCYHAGQNTCNCSDFPTQAQAQAQWFHDGYDPTDINRLDANHDGLVCESLP